MPSETATYLADLQPVNPAPADGMNQADDHMRLIKAVLQNTFPGFNAATGRIINSNSYGLILPDGAAGSPSYSFASEPTLGFRRSASGLILIEGGTLRGRGAVPVASMHCFPKEPASLGKGGTGTGWEYLECDGSTWNTSDFPDLAAFLGITASTFVVPKLTDTGRFLRSRRSGVAEGTAEANVIKAHNHTGTTDAQGNHAHNVSGQTGFMNQNQEHAHAYTVVQISQGINGGAFLGVASLGNAFTSTVNIDHTHNVSGSTDAQGNHAHNLNIAATGGAETRPEAYSVVVCIKT